jgi:SAM-dependent methyltransferase
MLLEEQALQMQQQDKPASQFYSGLVSELYEPLAGEHTQADPYTSFLDLCGTPALELACGSGRPLLDLLELGYDVEGLDASADMLELCTSRGAERGLAPVLHLAEMQSFRLGRRYESIFLAGASFTLLTDDGDALGALECMYSHLEPGGHALIPLEVEDVDEIRRRIGHHREVTDSAGNPLRFVLLALDVSTDGRNLAHHLRYERIPTVGQPTRVERIWKRRSWTQEQFRELVLAARFEGLTFLSPAGVAADPDASVFVALARRPRSSSS